MNSAKKFFTFMLVFLFAMTTLSQEAAAALLQCNQTTGAVTSGELYDQNLVSSSPATCNATDVDKIFSNLTCRFIGIINQTFSKFVCTLQVGLKDIVTVAITIYIMVFGLRVMMGAEATSSGSVIATLLKIAGVYYIAASTAAIDIVYRFFTGLVTESSTWVLKAVTVAADPSCVPGCLSDDLVDHFAEFDSKISAVINELFTSNSELLGFIFCAAAAPVFAILFSLAQSAFTALARTMTSFVMSIVSVAFLVALSPIFLSFMLFNSTHNLFESWLKFLVSYSLQPFILFAVFTLWVVIMTDFVGGFTTQLRNVMTIRDASNFQGSVNIPNEDQLRFCKLLYTNPVTNVDLSPMQSGNMPTIVIGGPRIDCCTIAPGDPNLQQNPGEFYCDPNLPALPVGSVDSLLSEQLVPPKSMFMENRFIYFLAYHLISFLVISYTFLRMLELAPSLAKSLTGAGTSMTLVGSGFKPGVSGVGGMRNFVSSATNQGRDILTKPFERIANDVSKVVNNTVRKGRVRPQAGGAMTPYSRAETESVAKDTSKTKEIRNAWFGSLGTRKIK